jgi:hypothetical protein
MFRLILRRVVAQSPWAERRWNVPLLAGAAWVVAVFAASHVFYYTRGIRFDVSTIPYFDQLLDPVLLRTRLLESVWNMHSQPPLFNLLTGVSLKLQPDSPEQLLRPVFLAAGLYTALCAYLLAVRLRLSPAVGALLATLVVVSPAFVLHEHWYFYPHLNVAWLLGGLAWLAQSRGRPGPEMALAAAHWAGLCLTRSLFHPLFFALMAVLVVARVAPGARPKAGLCFLLPGLLLGGWCAKNEALFGFFGTSSWGSRNVSHAVEELLGPNRVNAEARLGHLSPAIGVGPFESGERNVSAFGLTPRTTGIVALDEVNKQVASWHSVSYNHWSYPATSRFYASDARDLMKTYPRAYLAALRRVSLPNFLRPVDANGFLSPNREAIAELVKAFDAVDGSRSIDLVIVFGLALAIVASLSAATTNTERVVLSAALFCIAWVSVVGVAGELGENNRFRYKILWLSWIIASAGYSAAIRAAVSFWRNRALARRKEHHFADRPAGSTPGNFGPCL